MRHVGSGAATLAVDLDCAIGGLLSDADFCSQDARVDDVVTGGKSVGSFNRGDAWNYGGHKFGAGCV